MNLLQKLREYAKRGAYPMHMPGHKRNMTFANGLPFDIDITEIHGFDDLHDPRGVLLEIAQRGASLYGAASALSLVNGSTVGILAAIRAAVGGEYGAGSLVCSRYSHRAVTNAASLCGLRTVFVTPPNDADSGIIGSVTPEMIADALEAAPDTVAVVLTSPTYDGVVSDVAAIAELTHARDIPLIVDAAHGAHFGLSDTFPKNATRLGADIEIVSLHKTLPSMTQTSLLLVGDNSRVAVDAIARQLRVFQTSSPSYVLMSSIENCVSTLASPDFRQKLFRDYESALGELSQSLSRLKHLRRVDRAECFFGYDPGKIVISTLHADITGGELAERLRSLGFEVETHSDTHVLAMTSVADTRRALMRFADALLKIDATLNAADKTVRTIVPLGVDV
ncbi:MAG: aminotransferase class V-fold PLP-dependent enzyme [Oscillospiraceae bacterium]|jgi:arginine/lysine/ornithine decarboxylase|nr:aminotransferase class V-fold PLP-dependent enzyme [Oscillospiraceae bacterium]